MASYQIPQFLDSGDKIIGPLNMRQFGYALGGFMICSLIFTTAQSLLPGIGNYAIIACLPIAGLAGYLALGKFNGRDSEIYVLKYFLYNNKPKQMVYARVPEVTDLNLKLADWSSDKISKRWSENLAKKKAGEANEYLGFGDEKTDQKIRQIRQLGENVDLSLVNSLAEIQARQMEIEQKEYILRAKQAGKRR